MTRIERISLIKYKKSVLIRVDPCPIFLACKKCLVANIIKELDKARQSDHWHPDALLQMELFDTSRWDVVYGGNSEIAFEDKLRYAKQFDLRGTLFKRMGS